MIFLAVVFTFFAVFLLPDVACAWGPATHLELGQVILNNTNALAAPVRALLEGFPQDFLYGNISADIIVGKNLVEELKHCHHWKIGFRILKKAESDSQRAFAYGYLSHLAADTVAHNRFIPEMMIRTFTTRTLRHIYWEMRFDALADKSVWQIPKKIVKSIHQDNDRLLGSTIEDAPLSFRTNKTLFSSMLSLQRFNHWHRMLTLLSATSKWKLSHEVKDEYFAVCIKEMTGLLNHVHLAPCVKKDPTGRHSLEAAMQVRKKLKTVQRQGKDWEESMEKALRWVRM